MTSISAPAAEHTLVPTRRDHALSMLLVRWGVGSLGE